jgi:hypothetical protein
MYSKVPGYGFLETIKGLVMELYLEFKEDKVELRRNVKGLRKK